MKIVSAIGYSLLITLYSSLTYGQDSWEIDSTRVIFHISNADFEVEGIITGVLADIKFSKDKLDKSFFKATVKPKTIQTGIKLRDIHLKKSDYFDVERYPNIKIESNRITKSKDCFQALSVISIKGHSKNVIIPFTFNQTKKRAEFRALFSLNRLDFDLGEESIVLSDKVVVDIWIAALLVSK
jgi:polyisoprenoid-binding protein YceI